MLEGLLARFLASRLGKFVDGLDQENLNVALWRGEILLEHLRIKPAAVHEALGLLPLSLKWGKVGTFHLNVPWNALGARPLVITLKDVTLVFKLLDPEEDAADGDGTGEGLEAEARRRRRAVKERAVQERLRYLRASSGSDGAGAILGAADASRSKSLAERIFASMLETVQIRVSNFHLRIEGDEPEVPSALPPPLPPPGTRSHSASPVKRRRRLPPSSSGMAGPVRGDSVYYQPQEDDDDEEDDEEEEFLVAWEEEAEEGDEEEAAFHEVAPEGRVFALGLVLREFAVEGAGPEEEDEQQQQQQEAPTSGVVTAALVRKCATATALAVYCDHRCLPLVVYQTHAHPSALSTASPAAPLSPASPEEEHSYLLQLTSGALSLATRPVPLSPSKPQYDVACRISRVHVATTRPQVDRLATVAAAFSAFGQWEPEQQRLWRLRPRVPATEAPAAWWRYAKELALLQHRKERARRLGWPELVYLALKRQRYVALHKRRAAPDIYPPLLPAEAEEVLAMEERLRVEEVVYFRALAEAEASREEAARAQREGEEPSAVAGWLRSWFSGAAEQGGGGRTPTSPPPVEGAIAPASAGDATAAAAGGAGSGGEDGLLSAADQHAIEEAALAYGAALAQAASIPDHFTLHRLSLSVNEGSFSILESRERPIARLMVDAAATLHVRPHSWRLALAMGALEVLDLDPLTKYRTVVTRKTRARWSAMPPAAAAASKTEGVGGGSGGGGGGAKWPMLVVGEYRVPRNLDLTVEFNPGMAKGQRDVAVACRVLPFEVFYSRRLLEGVARVATDPDIEDARQAALRGLSGWRARQQARLLSSMAERQRILLDVEVEAPVVLVPETTRAGSAQLLVLDLGQLEFRNAPTTTGPSDGGKDDDDAWALRMRRMEVLMCREGAAYLERRETAADLHPVVEAFDVTAAVRTRVDPATRSLTHAALDACLPRLCVHLRASTVQYLHRVGHRRRAKARAASFHRRHQRRWGGSRFHVAPAIGEEGEEAGDHAIALVEPPGHAKGEEGRRVDRVLELQFRAPDITLQLEDDLEMQPLVEAAVQGIDGRVCVRSSAAEGGQDTAELALEIGALSLRDRHAFADASFADLLGSLGACGGDNSSGASGSLLSLSLYRQATREEDATQVHVGVRPLRLQWNPETVLALQRFFSFHSRRPDHRPSSSAAAAAARAAQPAAPSPPKPHPVDEDAARGGTGGGGGLAASIMSPMSASLYFASNDGSIILPPAGAGAPDAAAHRCSSFRLTATLEAVEVLLNKEGELRRLLGLTLSSAALAFEAAARGDKQLVGTITGLVVTDLGNVGTCFPRVLCAPAGEDDAALVVRLKYTSTGAAADNNAGGGKPEEEAAAPVRADNHLEVEVGPLQLVYFNHLSLEVIDYLCEGVLAAAVTGALRSADALVRQRALAKTGFTIRMARPRCLLPRLLCHPDHAVATIDSAALTTEFDFQTVRLLGPAAGRTGSSPDSSSKRPAVAAGGVAPAARKEREEAIVLRRFVIGFQGVELALASPQVAGHPPVLEAPLSFTVQVSRPLDVEYGARLAREWDGVELPLHVTAALGPVRLRATHTSYSLLRRVVEDNLLTQRHHAEALLKELRALDLPPLATRALQRHQHQRADSLQDSRLLGGQTSACCPQCAAPFRGREDGAHICPQCGDRVCRRCLSVSVFDKASGLVVRVCTECARASFPRLFSASGAGGAPAQTPTDHEAPTAVHSQLSQQQQTQQRIAYSYGLLDGVLTDIRVDVRLRGLALEVLEEGSDAIDQEERASWVPSALLAIEETHFHFRRPEDDRKVLDVSLYRCTVEAVGGAQPGRILYPSLEAEAAAAAAATAVDAELPPLSVGGDGGAAMEGGGQAPQFIYRYSSAPDEAPTTHLVLNHLNIVARFAPVLHLATFFGRMAEDPLDAAAASAGDAGGAAAGFGSPAPSPTTAADALGEGAGTTPGGIRPSTSVGSLGTLEANASSSSSFSSEPAPSLGAGDPTADLDSSGGVRQQEEPLLEVLRKVKVMVHHPRIIFPEASSYSGGDGGGGEAKAMVVRGLGVGSFVHEMERRMDGAVLPRSRWRAQLDGLECFIARAAGLEEGDSSPPPPLQQQQRQRGGGGGAGEEDVSLLTPVSLSLDYARVYSPLRSPLRSVRLAVEDLSTYVSYHDLRVVARVLDSWYRANIGVGQEQGGKAGGSNDGGGSHPPPPLARGLLPGGGVAAAVASRGYYEMTFTRTKLGLMLRKTDGMAVVDSVNDVAAWGQGEDAAAIAAAPAAIVPQKGDAIVSVNGQACSHSEVLQLVRTLPRPITLGFQRRGEPFTVSVSLDEIFLHRSKLPDCLLVSDKSARDGRASAMVVSVEGVSVEGKGYHAALALLQQRAASRPEADPAVVLGLRQLGQPARITDVELEVASVSLLAIDDAAGRDLPLLKARTQALQARVREIINPGPSAASPILGGCDARILSTAVYAAVQADYYNGRIGAWEPLLERVGVSGSLRREGPTAATAATTGPGLGQPGGGAGIASTILDVATTDALCVNMTDAGLELLLRTLAAWQLRQSQDMAVVPAPTRQGETPGKGGRSGGGGGATGASGGGGGGGGGAGGVAASIAPTSSSRGATHVFRNLTGLPTAFWTVRQEAGGAASDGIGGNSSGQGPILEAAAGSSVPFSVELHRGGGSGLLGAEGRNEARRREYDAVHTLFVRLAPGGGPLQGLELSCLPMTRTGAYSYRLPHVPHRRGGAGSGVAERVVWEVAAEEGRRVLTLRSAVRLANSSGVRLQLRCGAGGDGHKLLEVGPWETASLPLTWAGDKGPITLRPLEGGEDGDDGYSSNSYEWSGPLWDEPEDAAFGPADALRAVAVCPPAEPARRPLMLHLEAALEDEAGSYTLRVYAGATVVNLLPAAVRYGWRAAPALRGQSAPPEEVGVLQSGEERGLPCADVLGLGAELAFRLRGPAYEGLGASRWLRLGGGAWGVREVELADEAGNSLVVLADVAPRGPHGVTVTLYVEVWIENLTGLPLVYGEPRTAKAVETLAGPVTTDVALSAVQDAPVVEEVFEVRVAAPGRGGSSSTPRVETRWGSELGRPLPDKAHWRLPSAKAWAWAEGDWRVDLAGQVEPRGGWESSQLDYPDAFKPGRPFRQKDRIFRRRWVRRRVPVVEGEEGDIGDTAPLPGRSVLPFQPRVRQSTQTTAASGQQPQQQAAQQVVIKVGDSGWSAPLDVGVEGAGGAFQLVGNRWPGLPDDPRLCRRLYELTYRVAAAPPPWDRTRVLTVQGRYILHNDGPSPLLVGQHGACTGAEQQLLLDPGEAKPFHWPDYRRAALLVVSFPSERRGQQDDDEAKEQRYLWSGGIDIDAISDLPLVVRPHRAVSSSSSPSSSATATAAAAASSRLVRVRVELGGEEEGNGREPTDGGARPGEVEGAMAVTLAEVPSPRYPLLHAPASSGARALPPAMAAADLPLIWLENRSDLTVYYAQAGAAELEEEGLPPQHMQALGWDQVALAATTSGGGAGSSDLFGGGGEEEEDPFRVRLTLFPPQSPYRRLTAAYATVSPDAVGSVYTLELPAKGPSSSAADAPRAVLVEVTVDGPSKVLRLVNAGVGVGGRRRTLSGSEYGAGSSDPLNSSSGLREVGRRQQQQETGGGAFVFRARIACPAVVVSVVDDTPEEVLVLGLADVALQGAQDGVTSAGGWKTRLTVGSFQVDNHMARAHFPVVLRPADEEDGAGQERAADKPPSIRLDLDIAPPRPSLLLHVRLLRLGLRRLVLNLDQSTALAVQRLQQRMSVFSASSSASASCPEYAYLPHPAGAEQATVGPSSVARIHAFPLKAITAAVSESRASSPALQEQPPEQQPRQRRRQQQQRRKLFIERLRLESLAINLSLSRPRESPDEVYVGLRLNRMMADMMYRLDEARLKLQPFAVGYLMTTPRQIWWLCQAHYSREVKRHIFQMLGSLRALGKPVALIRGFGKGAQDFIAQPLQGLVRSVEELNPEEFVQGMARGADSLVRHTVGGVANSASCITDNLSKQLSNFSFDREYKLRRERREARAEKPADVLEGLGSGGKRLVRGLFDGVAGVVAAPIRGAERGGLKGLVKGVGKGMLGLVVKPVVGIADAATDVLHGVQGTAGAASTADQLLQLRPKRALYGSDRRLRAYDPLDAHAQALLAKATGHARGASIGSSKDGGLALSRSTVVQQQSQQEEVYADYAELGRRGGIVLISTARILVVNEEGETREILRLADILFAEAVEAGQKPGIDRTGVVLHLQVQAEGGGNGTTRALLVPCETPVYAQAFKFKLDQALLAQQSTAAGARG